ncbi:hypothetical protein, partial [Aulosira sp. FACHB-615]|uniref:hypothetical protein n=1 Tax=Aulosira sp. FACHB-615 TaxID=2692777 RepID=UPI0016835F99
METIQLSLNYLLEIVVVGFFSFMVVDFVNTAFASCTKAYAAAHIQHLDPSLVPELLATTTTAPATPEPTPTTPVPAQQIATPEFVLTDDPWQETQLRELPEPWELPTDIQPNPILPQAVVFPFPTLKLLPPAASVVQQTKPKSKTTKPKSTTTKKTTKPKPTN